MWNRAKAGSAMRKVLKKAQTHVPMPAAWKSWLGSKRRRSNHVRNVVVLVALAAAYVFRTRSEKKRWYERHE